MAEEAEGVVGSTWEEFKAHPYIIAGAVGAVVILLWYASRAKPGATPQQFAFSYGPSDAQVQAGTALAIAQQGDQTALSVANLQAGIAGQEIAANSNIAGQQITANSGAENDYFNYLINATNTAGAVAHDTNFYNALTAITPFDPALPFEAADVGLVTTNASSNAAALLAQGAITAGGGIA